MFENDIRDVGGETLSEIASNFSRYAKVTIAHENLKRELIISKVMKIKDGAYCFNHPYVYHYFVARYLSTIIRDPDASAEFETKLSNIINNLQDDESANIVVFLCYLVPGDASLIDKIIRKARELFTSQKEFNFPSDAEFFDRFSYKEPVITVYAVAPETARTMSRRALDEQQHEDKLEKSHSREIGVNEKEIITEIRLANKVMLVLGQILRSFPGSPGKRKHPLAEECCKLGMRLLSASMKELIQKSPAVRKQFVDFFKKEFPKAREGYAIAHANSFVFMLGEMSSQNIIKSVAMSIGSPRLAPLYDEMLQIDQSVTFQLINICIRLNHFKAIPEREMVATYKAVKGRHFSSTLLKILAIECLLRHPPSISKQQSIFKKLGIVIDDKPSLSTRLAKARLVKRGR